MAERPITPEEEATVLSRELQPQLRFAGIMPGKFKEYDETERTWAQMHELGLISYDLYLWGLRNRHSFTSWMPTEAAPNYIAALSESKNPTPLLIMGSQAIGAKIVGNEAVAIRREDIPGMDPRELKELLQDPLIQKKTTMEGGLEMVRAMLHHARNEGERDDDDVDQDLAVVKQFGSLMNRFGLLSDVPPPLPEERAHEYEEKPPLVERSQPEPEPQLVEEPRRVARDLGDFNILLRGKRPPPRRGKAPGPQYLAPRAPVVQPPTGEERRQSLGNFNALLKRKRVEPLIGG